MSFVENARLTRYHISLSLSGHENIAMSACATNNTDAEDELQLDDDEIMYVDFKNKEVVFTLPEFAGSWTALGWYQRAQANHQVCLSSLKVAVQVEQSPPEEIGENSIMSETKKHIHLLLQRIV